MKRKTVFCVCSGFVIELMLTLFFDEEDNKLNKKIPK